MAAFDLRDRVALITGAGSPSGIGFACASLLSELGASVLCSTTERVHERAASLPRSSGFVADLTDSTQCAALIDHVRATHARLDILVNAAGMTSELRPAEVGTADDISVHTWRRTMDLNATTAFEMSKLALPLMRPGAYGRIINITSVTGPVMAMRGDVAYAAAKAAMVGLTRALALDVATQGITVNAVAPGWIDTASLTDHERAQGRVTPCGRCGTPAEVAGAVAWLASPSASYTTGQVIVIDGGNSVAEERA